jgi:hypothetical protein
MDMADEYITVAQVRERLGNISKAKMAQLIADGHFTAHPNLLDLRSKLIKVTEVEDLLKNRGINIDEYVTVGQLRKLLGNINKAKMAQLIAKGYFATYPNPLDERSKLIRKADVDAFLSNGAVAHRRRNKSEAPSHATRRRGTSAGDSSTR